jgi:PAS domain S-box-containing protein
MAGRESVIKSWVGVPIITGDRFMGVLSMASLEEHELEERDKTLLMSVAKTMGVLIDNARLFDGVMNAKAEWESTFDTMTSGVFIQDRDFTIIRSNRALAEMLETTPEQIIGRKCYEVLHATEQPVPDCPSLEAMATGKNVSRVMKIERIGKTLNISADPLLDDHGNVIGAVHDVRDITEQEQMREQLIESERLRALGEMASGVAHDFNNFLTVILGNSQLLLAEEGLTDEMRDALETIQTASTHAADTVRRIQEFTRVRTTRRFTPVDINKVLRSSVVVVRPKWRDEADSRGIKIDVNLDLGAVPMVEGSDSELSEVFVNLLINAIDAMPGGGSIGVTSRADDGMIEVRVADTGEGMPREVRRHIFEPFFSTKGPQGSGLGLSLAYGIVGRHEGDIRAESTVGKGSTFVVRLPAVDGAKAMAIPEKEKPAARAAKAAAAEEEQATGEKQPAEPVAAECRGRILVIDDEEMIRVLVHDVVCNMGHEVETAESGHEGIEKFGAGYDLVLTDLGMAGMSGWDVVERIKEMSPGTPVALITGWGDQLDSERMEASGVDLVMAKPFSVAQIRSLVTKVLKSKA